MTNNHSAVVTNVQGYSIHDGPGIRTVVFLKGCSLECQWCSNPECISPLPEVGFFKNLCTKCGKCAGVCPEGALVYEEGKLPYIDRGKCTGCGKCSSVCSYQALVLHGKPMSTGEVLDAVKKDEMFYRASGGGVTVSGGEPLLKPEFVSELLDKCRRANIHTCMETSGCASESALRQVLPYIDYMLYDLKHMDSEKHRKYTGKPNDLILSNARVVADSGVETLFRMPLIPGINDDEQNIKETAKFLLGSGHNDPRIELMPYHRLGKGKYESLGRQYLLSGLLTPEPEHLESIKRMFEDSGIMCAVSR